MSVASFRERSYLLDSLHPRSMMASRSLLQHSDVKIFLASVSSGIHTMWPNREACRVWTTVERCSCLHVHYSEHDGIIWFPTASVLCECLHHKSTSIQKPNKIV